jgi:aminopeptidase N
MDKISVGLIIKIFVSSPELLKCAPMHETSYCRVENFDARFSLKGTTAVYPPDRLFDMQHIKLSIQVDFKTSSFSASCDMQVQALSDHATTIDFDAVHFHIQSVQWNGQRVKYRYNGKKLTVSISKPVSKGTRAQVVVSYRVKNPRLGFYFIKPDRHYPKRPTQIWTQGEDEYARYWFPCLDLPGDRTTTEVIATVPKGFLAVSNGSLVSVKKGPKSATYHWRQSIAHAVYLVSLTVGRFNEIKDRWKNIPVTYYMEKGREDDARRAFGKTPRMLEFFSSKIGVKYPYSKYAQIAAHDFIYGGMENTSATTQTEYALLDERAALDYSSDELVAHELAHQWFGDYLTCKSWDHAWLNESFATYFDALFKRFDKGDDEFFYQLHMNAQEYFSEDKHRYRRPIVTNKFRRPSDLFDRHLYEKGSLVLHMLHKELGDKSFWKSMRAYVSSHAGRVVETLDLINAVETTTGRSMRRFFDQWVFGSGHPEYRLRWWWNNRTKRASIRLVQTNKDIGVFQLNTEVLFIVNGQPHRKAVTLDKAAHLFSFDFPSQPALVLFDPDHAIVKKVDFPKTEEELLTQLFHDPHPLGRIEAAKALAPRAGERALDALLEALKSDVFWGVRVEVAKALGSTGRDSAALAMISILDQTPHHKVRRAIYAGLKNIKNRVVGDEIAERILNEKSYFAAGEALNTLAVLGHPRAEEYIHDALRRESWNDITRVFAAEALAQLKDPRHIPVLISLTKPGVHQRTRMAAVRALATYGPGHDVIQKKLLNLVNDDFVLMQNTALRALHATADERALPQLKRISHQELDGRTLRMAEEAIEKIQKGFDA